MKHLKFIPLQLTLVLILGILTGYFYQLKASFVSYILIFLLIVLISVYFYQKPRLYRSINYTIITLVLFFSIGVFSISLQKNIDENYHYMAHNVKDNKAENYVLRINEELRTNHYYHRFEASILQINSRKAEGKILLNIARDTSLVKLDIGNEIMVRALLKKVDEPKNPYQFNYKEYLEKQNIYRQITIDHYDCLILDSNKTNLRSVAHHFRKKINSSLVAAGFKNDELNIINALLLGQRQDVSKELIENYTKAGAIHILAISGLHVGIILWLLTMLLKPLERLKNGKTLKLIIALILLWCFAFVAGLSPSVVRAVTMFTAIAISVFGNSKSNTYNNLVISMFFLLLLNPMYLFDVGFQLSYLAVFFIVWLQPIIYKIWIPKWKSIDYLWKIFTVSITAQIGVLPLSLYYFHQFPSLFFITNLVIIPILGFILGLGIIVIFLSLVNLLPVFLASSFQKLIYFMNQFIGLIAEEESFLFQNISFSIFLMISSYLLIVFGFRWIEKKTYARLLYAISSIILLQSIFIYEKWSTSSKNELIVFNKSKTSVIGQRKNNQLVLNHSLDSLSRNDHFLKSYITGANNLDEIVFIDSLDKGVLFKRNILLIDSLNIYKVKSFKSKSILLTQSPKINLERLIKTLDPTKIIADNSNYTSFVEHWKQTCLKHKIPFHYTNKDGAFILTK